MKLLALLRWFVAAAMFAGFVTASPGAEGDAPAASADKPEVKDLVLKGDAKCTGCHDESDRPKPTMLDLHPQVLKIGKTKHGTQADSRTPTCTDCHGESKEHLNYKGSGKPPKPDRQFTKNTPTPAEVRNDACLSCHKKDAKRSHWAGSTHDNRDIACNNCHQIHAEQDAVRDRRTQATVCFSCHKEQRTQIDKPSHHPIPEGKMACSDCHNAHGSVGPKLMKRDSVNETCYTCHMEKRGPFVHNHEPVNEDCSTCHNPHGTVVENMLKVRAPMLCHQCHTPHGPKTLGLIGQPTVDNSGTAGKSGINYTMARSCLNCHTQVHGSNNPSTTEPTPQFNFR